jgi:hypothetical protein
MCRRPTSGGRKNASLRVWSATPPHCLGTCRLAAILCRNAESRNEHHSRIVADIFSPARVTARYGSAGTTQPAASRQKRPIEGTSRTDWPRFRAPRRADSPQLAFINREPLVSSRSAKSSRYSGDLRFTGTTIERCPTGLCRPIFDWRPATVGGRHPPQWR